MTFTGGSLQVGSPVPALTAHAVSVSLPKWVDNVDYEEGRPRVVGAMQTGYPRFFIHRDIQKLAQLCLDRFGRPTESCVLFPSSRTAKGCQAFLCHPSRGDLATASRTIRYCVRPAPVDGPAAETASNGAGDCELVLHLVLFPADRFPLAKSYWQHTGQGISSRRAERCLRLLGSCPVSEANGAPPAATSTADDAAVPDLTGPKGRYGRNKHYAPSRQQSDNAASLPSAHATSNGAEHPVEEAAGSYLEERYGRNLSSRNPRLAKTALRRRIAGVLRTRTASSTSGPADDGDDPALATSGLLEPSERGDGHVSEHDVYLYPGGMAAIFEAHQLVLSSRDRPVKSVCFGFPYTDTLKILEKWGPGCHFFGHGTDDDLDRLEDMLVAARLDGSGPVVQALFCEFPSNPLLRSPDLERIRALADEHDFVVVVDETIGNFVNVEVLPFADIVVSSLTKVFSGDSNVMGGSLVLSPSRPKYALLKAQLDAVYEDVYFDEDAVFMERNSRDFRPRIATINRNAEVICDLLVAESSDGSGPVKEVYYPRHLPSRKHYEARMRAEADDSTPGYGGLFSVTFRSMAASEAFFDSLQCYKGPSLGTNFTLASPYTLLAHYNELDWAAAWGVEKGLVRVSVGLEEPQVLLGWFRHAVEAARRAHAASR